MYNNGDVENIYTCKYELFGVHVSTVLQNNVCIILCIIKCMILVTLTNRSTNKLVHPLINSLVNHTYTSVEDV